MPPKKKESNKAVRKSAKPLTTKIPGAPENTALFKKPRGRPPKAKPTPVAAATADAVAAAAATAAPAPAAPATAKKRGRQRKAEEKLTPLPDLGEEIVDNYEKRDTKDGFLQYLGLCTHEIAKDIIEKMSKRKMRRIPRVHYSK